MKSVKVVGLVLVWAVVSFFFYNNVAKSSHQAQEVVADNTSIKPAISERRVEVRKGRKGREYESYIIEYKFAVDGIEYVGEREVSKEVYDGSANKTYVEGIVYFNKNPEVHGSIDEFKFKANLLNDPIGLSVLGGLSLIVALLLLWVYRKFLKVSSENAVA